MADLFRSIEPHGTAIFSVAWAGEERPEFFTLPKAFVRQHYDACTTWQKVKLRKLAVEIGPLTNGLGFEQIGQALGVPRPRKPPPAEAVEDDA